MSIPIVTGGAGFIGKGDVSDLGDNRTVIGTAGDAPAVSGWRRGR